MSGKHSLIKYTNQQPYKNLSFSLILFSKHTSGVTKKRNYITMTFVIVKIVTFAQMFLKGF